MRFFFIGDMGSGTDYQKQVSESLQKEIKKYKKQTFVCGLGDNIYEEGCVSVNDDKFRTHFEEPYSNISNKIPFYMCLGNHDYGNCYKGNKFAKHQINYTNHSKKWKMPSNYYKFGKKDNGTHIDFFVIDTNLEFHSKREIKKQLQTLIEWIQKSKADWKVVIGHHTWRSVAGHGNAEPLQENFLTELIEHAPFDVYLCGHDHTKQVIQTKIKDKDITMIVCGTGGKVYKDIPDNFDNTPDIIYSSHNLGFGICNVYKHHLDFDFINEHNQSEFKYRIHKN
tara:strand:+ start:775 stop:1617 length:843 start_codon:yes stop_codon:yes gene_type:complete